MHGKTLIGILLFALLALPVLGENITLSQSQNVSIVCNNASQCVTVVNGQPVFFPGADANTTLSVASSFSYEPNVFVVQNVTVINQTNVTVETVNLTVQACNASPILNVSTDQIVASLNASLLESCHAACGLSDADKNALQNQATQSQNALTVASAQYQASLNATVQNYESRLNISQKDLDVCESETNNWIVMVVILVLILAFWLFINYRNSRPPKVAVGPVSEPMLEPAPINPFDLPQAPRRSLAPPEAPERRRR